MEGIDAISDGNKFDRACRSAISHVGGGQRGRRWEGHLGPVTGAELLTALTLRADRRLLIFDTAVGDIAHSDGIAKLLTVAECMANVTSDYEALGSNELAASASAITEMLGQSYLYQYSIADLPGTSDPVEVWAELSGHSWNKSPTLPKFAGEFYASIHDDCYAYLEARDPQMIWTAISVLVAIAMSNAAVTDDEWPEAIAPDHQIIDELLGDARAFVLDTESVEVRPSHVIARFARQRWTLRDTVEAWHGFLRYDRATGRYSVLKARPDAVMRVHGALELTKRGTFIAGTVEYGSCHRGDIIEWTYDDAVRTAVCQGIEMMSGRTVAYTGLVVADIDPGEFVEGEVVMVYRAGTRSN